MRDTLHFSGVGGVGMSALAQIAAMEGRPVSGSDRDFDRGRNLGVKALLEKLGVKIYPQDGSGVNERTSELALSTAIEDTNPEVVRAKAAGIKISHRSELLAAKVEQSETVVVAGTSGKSTVAAMLFAVLEEAGLGPSIITGGALLALKDRGLIGNAFRGTGKILIVEGDESDGTLTRYHPKIGLLLNVSKDHKDLDELDKIFGAFLENCGERLVNADDPPAARLAPFARAFGFSAGGWKVENVKLEPFGSKFSVNGVPFSLPLPGEYNVANALAATAAAGRFGAGPATAAAALAKYRGVERRFVLVGEKGGVKVVDDFAHNPAKVDAALKALRLAGGGRVLAVYQPHGFAPTRHLKAELIKSFSEGLKDGDILLMPEIYYAGGTANKDISANDIVAAVAAAGRDARFFPERAAMPAAIAALARPGDIVGVMGARDATLSDFARQVFEALPAAAPATGA